MRTLVTLWAVLLLTGCGDAGIGEPCEALGECEDGAICGDNGAKELECLRICESSADCPRNDECIEVLGSEVLGCRTGR